MYVYTRAIHIYTCPIHRRTSRREKSSQHLKKKCFQRDSIHGWQFSFIFFNTRTKRKYTKERMEFSVENVTYFSSLSYRDHKNYFSSSFHRMLAFFLLLLLRHHSQDRNTFRIRISRRTKGFPFWQTVKWPLPLPSLRYANNANINSRLSFK